jgi:hypothetical protein
VSGHWDAELLREQNYQLRLERGAAEQLVTLLRGRLAECTEQLLDAEDRNRRQAVWLTEAQRENNRLRDELDTVNAALAAWSSP